MLGTVLRQLGKTDEALAEFREAVRLQPASAEGHLGLGQLLQQTGDRAGAAAAFEEARRLNERKAQVQASLGVGRAQLKGGNIAGAIEQFQRAITLAPENFEAHYELAKAFSAEHKTQAAREHLAEARRLAPHRRFRDP
jgi:tetratricopeptide (TPR) repeat protein